MAITMIKIVTDSAADITPAQAKSLGITVLPLRIHFGDTVYYQEEDETFVHFYELLEASQELPHTSQASPTDYLALFEQAKQDGDSIVLLTLSSGLSGTIQSAGIAKEMVDYDEIYIVDSRQAVVGQRLLTEYAVKLRDEGKSAKEIAAMVEEARGRVVLAGAVDTLKYLHKGGRVSKSVELVGSVLGVKPIIFIDEAGALKMVDKARGFMGCANALFKIVEKYGAPDPYMPVYFGHTNCPESCERFRKAAVDKYGFADTVMSPVGGIVGTHLGPGTFIIAYLKK